MIAPMPDSARALESLQEALGEKYEVCGWIGSGGMAQVYLARHRVTGGRFAVKVLADHLSHDEGIVRRFLQEARTAATLSGHPNVVSIFDVGQSGDLHYLIMQYVEGEDLRSRLARCRKLAPAEALAVAEQVAEALVFAASKQIVHRDLKPSNVLIDASGRAVVLDFGIAKAGDVPSVMTAAGERLGTPYYMSPEHFRDGACDHRSDLYALGVMLFELLTGARPFEGDSVRAIEEAHLMSPPPSPCDRDPEIPPAVGAIVLKLLAKQPALRYQHASALLEDLRTARGAQAAVPTAPAPEPAAPAPVPEDSGSSWVWRVLAVVALVAAIVGGAAYWLRRDASPAPPAAAAGIEIDAAPVSNSAYNSFCDATGYPYPEAPPDAPDYFYAQPGAPVLNLTQKEAAAFAGWSGKRLPTAQEWDQAAADRAAETAVWEWTSSPASAAGSFVVKSGGAGGVRQMELPGAVRPGRTPVAFRCAKDPPRH
jgi:predicted Ser/Thr protein kinase